MLFDLFKNGITQREIIEFALYIIIILISLSVHELFHGYVAYRCGDATARNFGRLTLNPLRHLDPIGTIMMMCFGFGYAKPVPINPRNFNHFKRDLCFVSLAGPFSNLCLSFIGGIAYYISWALTNNHIYNMFMQGNFSYTPSIAVDIWLFFCFNFMIANASLAVFNLLPIPPLDGSRIVSTLLPGKISYYYLKYEQYIMIALFLLLWNGVLDNILMFFVNHITDAIKFVADLILYPLAAIL